MSIRTQIETEGVARWMVAPRCAPRFKPLVAYASSKPWRDLTWLSQRRLQKHAHELFWPQVAAIVKALPLSKVPRVPSVEGMDGWVLTARPAYLSPRHEGRAHGERE